MKLNNFDINTLIAVLNTKRSSSPEEIVKTQKTCLSLISRVDKIPERANKSEQEYLEELQVYEGAEKEVIIGDLDFLKKLVLDTTFHNSEYTRPKLVSLFNKLGIVE